MRYVLLVLPVLFLFVACGPKESAPPEIVSTDEAMPAAEDQEMTDEQAIDGVRRYYDEVTAKVAAGSLQKDSIEYSCEDAMRDGTITFYSNAGGIVMVNDSYSMGDHSGQTDQWYFNDGDLVFLYEQGGYWSFGGPMSKDEDGNEVPGTVDKITENRFYFNDGALVQHLTKSYSIESWKEERNPDSVPNETSPHNGEIPASYDFIAAVMATRVADCGTLE